MASNAKLRRRARLCKRIAFRRFHRLRPEYRRGKARLIGFRYAKICVTTFLMISFPERFDAFGMEKEK